MLCDTMKRTAVYIRVSTQEQAQEGYSVGEQKERLVAYCKAHDWVIADIYVDGGYSGANLNRPAIQKLMTETQKFDVVLVYKLDRLSRSQRDTLYLIEEVFLPNKVDFVSMQESFDTSSPFGKAMIGLLAVFAQLEREQIKERTRMGRMARAKAGLHQGAGCTPIGYNYQDGKLVINPYEAEQVRKIYEWYLNGLSFQAIVDKLHEAGYTNRYSSYNHWTSVRNILSNATYTGRLRYGEVVVENAHEAIITEEQFKVAQDLKAKKHEIYGTNAFQAKHLLTGMIFCGYCGARYYHHNVVGYKYYSCYSRTRQHQRMVKNNCCKNKHWKAEKLESIVCSRVREIIQSPNIAFEIAEQNRIKPTVVNTETITIEKRIREIDKQINKFMELYQMDGIPPEILNENINKLYNEKTSLQSMLKPVEEVEDVSFDLIEALLKNAAQVWDFADESQKRRILQDLIKRIVLTDGVVDIEWNF